MLSIFIRGRSWFKDKVHTSRNKRRCGLTALFGHASGDLEEDPGVADDHDDQRQQEEAGEGEHVVGCFLPVTVEAASGGALSEVGWIGDAHVVEDKYLLNFKKHLKKKKKKISIATEFSADMRQRACHFCVS